MVTRARHAQIFSMLYLILCVVFGGAALATESTLFLALSALFFALSCIQVMLWRKNAK